MTWSISRYMPRRFGSEYPYFPFRVNERCFIRKDHICRKNFGASKSCFIACPNDDELETILSLISEKLTKVGIEPIIAVKERAYGQDIFCTKICGKIIESQFCIVILDDCIEEGRNIPNPNVYYEYGLMTSLKKHIIPLQKENLKLAFNIQSYDTIKYTSKNISIELDRAIKDAIKLVELKVEDKRSPLSEKTILRNFEMSGFELKENSWFLSSVVEDTNFRGFGRGGEFYVYLGKIDTEEDAKSYLEDLNVVVYRSEKKGEELKNKINELKGRKKAVKEENDGTISEFRKRTLEDNFETEIKDLERKLEIMSIIYLGFIFTSNFKQDDFLAKVGVLVEEHPRFKVTSNRDNEMMFGETKVNLKPPST